MIFIIVIDPGRYCITYCNQI